MVGTLIRDIEDNADLSTEQKILLAARTVFHKKGFVATRTRDIAEESGINLALLNYYFRSKAKLFEIVMIDTMADFLQSLMKNLNDVDTNLAQKVEMIAAHYIDFMSEHPDIPVFLLTEMRNDVANFAEKLPFRERIEETVFMQQYLAEVVQGKVSEPDPLNFLMNLLGLILVPFLMKPVLLTEHRLDEGQFSKMMQQRKKLIPIWVNAMLEADIAEG
ncbi:transcriptional regulator, TetR family [Acinetobacter marinus]|uniref:Transcriptional regulator, TetR family n=1 Tax=Acinetobacter marinus TaxID=281375 RepID=A0A1G6GKD4_9GAMM|nr:TetR family transcriptional regulator [Acinetobacter marinus]SDB82410.1 transcriptional regulator, TetR family [Acinetobacter marinus]